MFRHKGNGARLMGGAVIQIMTQREQSDAEHGIKDFLTAVPAIMTNGDRTYHYAQSQTADGNRHDIAMVQYATPQREQAEGNGDTKPDFMDQRIEQQAARGRQNRDEGDGRDTMNNAKAG
jgi:hypothetical protein